MKNSRILVSVLAILSLLLLASCDGFVSGPSTTSKQADKAKPKVARNADGTTLEQDNIRAYREAFSDPKSIKHLYIFNGAGDAIFYDTVRGKVTSGGKRLRPKTVAATDGRYIGSQHYGIKVNIDGEWRRTSEVPSFDGTWGNSSSYIYWRNSAGNMRKLHVGAGMSWMETTAPMRLVEAKIRIETEEEGN